MLGPNLHYGNIEPYFFLDLIANQFQYLKYIGTQGNYVVASDVASCCLFEPQLCEEMSKASGLLAHRFATFLCSLDVEI